MLLETLFVMALIRGRLLIWIWSEGSGEGKRLSSKAIPDLGAQGWLTGCTALGALHGYQHVNKSTTAGFTNLGYIVYVI